MIPICVMAALSMSRQREEGIANVICHRTCSLHAATKWPWGEGGYHLKPILESPGPYMSLDLFCFPSDGHEREKMFLEHHAHKASRSVGLLP